MPFANAGCDPLLPSAPAADYPVNGTVPAVHSDMIAINSNRICHDEDTITLSEKGCGHEWFVWWEHKGFDVGEGLPPQTCQAR